MLTNFAKQTPNKLYLMKQLSYFCDKLHFLELTLN